jgi:hypothetical protein
MKNSLSLPEPSANETTAGVGRVARCLRKNGLQIVADAWVTASLDSVVDRADWRMQAEMCEMSHRQSATPF